MSMNMLWAGLVYLVFGALLLGVLEGLALARVFNIPRKRCIVLLVAANYVVAW